MREWERKQELPKECVFCRSTSNLTTDHLIPRSRGGDDSADNVVLACQSCNISRGEKGIFEWFGLKEKDKLHRLVAGMTKLCGSIRLRPQALKACQKMFGTFILAATKSARNGSRIGRVVG